MFEKFTEKGRKIIIYAKEEAEKRSNDYLGTEHFLLAILREEDGVPVTILKKMGLSIEEVRYEVEKSLPVGSSLMTFGDIPFTPRAKKVLELAIEEARLLGHAYIGSEHLLCQGGDDSSHRTGTRARMLRCRVDRFLAERLFRRAADHRRLR